MIEAEAEKEQKELEELCEKFEKTVKIPSCLSLEELGGKFKKMLLSPREPN